MAAHISTQQWVSRPSKPTQSFHRWKGTEINTGQPGQTKVNNVPCDKSNTPLPGLALAQTWNSSWDSQCPPGMAHGPWVKSHLNGECSVRMGGEREVFFYWATNFSKSFIKEKICWKICHIFSNYFCLVNIFRDPGRWVIYFQGKSIISTYQAFVSAPGALCYLVDILHLFQLEDTSNTW